jgi:hypothetical protein
MQQCRTIQHAGARRLGRSCCAEHRGRALRPSLLSPHFGHFAKSLVVLYSTRVKTLSTIRGLLAILAIVGLVLGPIARPAMAVPMHTAVASDQAMVDEAAMAMPEGMPCCPKKSPIPDCDRDCLLMAMCAMQFLCNAVQTAGLVIPLGMTSVVSPGNDTDVAGLSQGPPPRPPKI